MVSVTGDSYICTFHQVFWGGTRRWGNKLFHSALHVLLGHCPLSKIKVQKCTGCPVNLCQYLYEHASSFQLPWRYGHLKFCATWKDICEKRYSMYSIVQYIEGTGRENNIVQYCTFNKLGKWLHCTDYTVSTVKPVFVVFKQTVKN
jgi:hypothetical protein